MKAWIVKSWDAIMDNEHNPLRHLDLASQHYFMQVLGWMWSMVFSLSFLSIFHFGFTWILHVLLFGGIAFTVAVFREAEKRSVDAPEAVPHLGQASTCIWMLDREA
ncbi:MAG: hypothetical protein P8Y92_10425 [Halioglobus sp.]|jgi:hypothetical protein